MDLGANEWTTFWKVTFPMILPGIMAAALLAFSLSIDDYVITSFTAGRTSTFPIFIWGSAPRRRPGPGQRHRHGLLPDRGGLRGRHHVPRSRPTDRCRRPADRATSTGGAAPDDPPRSRGLTWSTPPSPGRPADTAPLPDHSVVPAGLGPDHRTSTSTAARARG